MKTFNYSIIIPHYNIPDLLQRCLDSIPVRDDVQVIVVDDHSSSQVVDFQHFPKYSGGGYETYFSPKNLGCGGARNAALPLVKGKWITCLDADDLLTNDADKIFDKYADSDADVIRFGMEHRDCITLTLNPYPWYTKALNDKKYPDIWKLLNCSEPWAIFMKTEFLSNNNLRWEDVRYHENTVFAAKVAVLARKFEIHPDEVFYVYTSREGSLVNTISKESTISHFETDKRKFEIVRQAGLLHELSNYQIEHLPAFKRLTLYEQIPLLWQMFTCGMLFYKSKYNPISNKLILNQLAHALWKGFKNTFKH